jgi:HAD superfamily hydrolase (TIGR01509 family)
MKQVMTALFDFDGVIVDTEPIYDIFWNAAGLRYHLGEHFGDSVKGVTLPDIIKTFFFAHPAEEIERLLKEATEYESNMPLPALPGSIAFLRTLKDHHVKIGLVTSSDDAKMKRAFALHHLEGFFDTVVTADRITKGKPDPMCYRLAATDLNVSPADCIVFEDSINGIRSATEAGMRVVGLSTTNPAETIKGMVYKVIPNFEEVTYEQYAEFCEQG